MPLTDDDWLRYDAMDDDDTPCCEVCGERMTADWEGDPNVIGGTNDFYFCESCPEPDTIIEAKHAQSDADCGDTLDNPSIRNAP